VIHFFGLTFALSSLKMYFNLVTIFAEPFHYLKKFAAYHTKYALPFISETSFFDSIPDDQIDEKPHPSAYFI
jgi:hypothetical protein